MQTSGPAAGQTSGRVLVVDDHPPTRELIRLNLELEGFAVVEAGDGQEAVDLLRGHTWEPPVQVVTLDVVMPRLDGFATAAQLRSDPSTRHLKIVMITAAAQGTDLARGTSLGVDGYLTKPFDPDTMVALVRRLTDGGQAP